MGKSWVLLLIPMLSVVITALSSSEPETAAGGHGAESPIKISEDSDNDHLGPEAGPANTGLFAALPINVDTESDIDVEVQGQAAAPIPPPSPPFPPLAQPPPTYDDVLDAFPAASTSTGSTFFGTNSPWITPHLRRISGMKAPSMPKKNPWR
ncbi:hypothetical protein C2E23DRAFT_859283 [Lenzites betulinus]|nr:hypothetical protein C2E23DRAFT_859283 [Lenzites betulinus]